MKIDLYTQKGEKKGTMDVQDAMFKAPIKEELVRLAVMRQMANAHGSTAHVKTRAEVSGGGRKPWKQKGTGRARFGSTRNPIWRHGGVAFGPRGDRNYSQRMPKGARHAALFSCLSSKAGDNGIFALDKFDVKQPKTKEFAQMMSKLPVSRSLLVVISEKNVNIQKSADNLPNVKVILVNYLNPHDLLTYEKVMFMEPAIKKAEELFLKQK
jgi:large subunit ribosomal protein L4